ncbi:type I site-specific deoxyribonuclease, HsdR family [Leptospira santarosai str. CBC379]|uniref:Type I restriction enzyme endonuclease subunit n=1 Tax=Leptospira santarosai str. MOR084 TaxID=1049984 RepID=A0A0E2BP13_9LEPT|nr:HsdR family type I site-specific deoxyribonuclease [Leptospira santarosai]EKO33111.1 type I site-specific deoxyribonuclease, HsdR family [Leptospira santarosai str. MOR084]EKR92926.1 type I site-specific deoxyribonuclease, HsdR family [Leptospira santarosai str. CBC379]
MSEEYKTPNFDEDSLSQAPALQLLESMGWTYLSPEETNQLRGGKRSQVLLESILIPWLRENNKIQNKGQIIPFTEGNILSGVSALKDVLFDGLIRTNEKIYDLLCLGKSLIQAIDGDTKSYTLFYIDWEHPEKNVFHVTEEFSVEKSGSHDTRRPDIVLFVNGIPLVVIECKSPNIKDPIKEAILQQKLYQQEDEIPKLYYYTQILLALSKNEAQFATVGTERKFWAVWKEKDPKTESELDRLVKIQISDQELTQIQASKKGTLKAKSPRSGGTVSRKITIQDRTLYSLCRPERFLELTYQFVLFDKGEKKVARYQQYFCVKKITERIQTFDSDGIRNGGVVWHTQGSGKSLTMVLLAKAIALLKGIKDYKIVIVTDRIDLDDQIEKTFHACGKDVEKAKTGKHLVEMITEDRQRIISTVIDKFDASFSNNFQNDDRDIFVLVDEGHRGQYGSRHAKMKKALPNACFLAFTGTPIMRKEKNTILKFGGLIDTYTIDQAVTDKAIVPLLYEGRHVEQKVDSEGIDAWFERITSNLSKDQARDLKQKFSTTEQLNKATQKVKAIAWDISEHFQKNFQNEEVGPKGQLVAQDKATALLYKKYLDEFEMVSSEVLISPPEEKEGDLESEEDHPTVQNFWKRMMQKYGSEKQYNRIVIDAFKESDEPEIIIVVDKLLTGFDAPRNTVLYLTRKLQEHTLLQAIARVNRLNEGKDFGVIIDYRGILENLNHALDLYSKLPDFDPEDLKHILTDMQEEIKHLPQIHSTLWETFKSIKNKKDEEEFEELLGDEKLRNTFFERLSAYARTLGIALSNERFLEETSKEKLAMYRENLGFFAKLRVSVRRRYAEIVDFSEYEPRIQKLLDTHVGAGAVEKITPLVSIFNTQAFQQELDQLDSDAAKADTIAHRTAKTIREKMGEDPAFYKKFSKMLQESIDAYKQKRLDATEYLKKVTKIQENVRNRTGDDIPDQIRNNEITKAYYGTIRESLLSLPEIKNIEDQEIASLALEVESIIEKNRIVNWKNDSDIQKKMIGEMEDILFEFKKSHNLNLTFADLDEIMNEIIDIAKTRRA